jgi:hypothetical protein
LPAWLRGEIHLERIEIAWQLRNRLKKVTVVSVDYEVKTSDVTQDPAWDAFLAAVPGGHHVQTGLWSQVKALIGLRMDYLRKR